MGMKQSKIIGYGYRRNPKDLKAVGAEAVFVDWTSKRQERAAMVHKNAFILRSGDTLLLLSLRDLGGSPVADRVWREKIEALGVKVMVVDGPKRPGRIGRPRKYDPDLATAQAHYDIWLNSDHSISSRLEAIALSYGSEVTRGVLNSRYGWPGRPKVRPEKEEQGDGKI